jgi:hypothetical protein
MKTSSAKAKGRNLQKLVVDLILKTFPVLEPDDVVSTSMGAGGEDIKLSPAARKILPLSIECKNQEKLNLYSAWEQTKANAKGFSPVLVIKKNRTEPLVVITLDHFLSLFSSSKTPGETNRV